MHTMARNAAWGQLIGLVRQLAFLEGEEDEFQLASGRSSRYFFDMKPLMLDPEAATHLMLLLRHELVALGVDIVGGLELGAVPLTALAVAGSDHVTRFRGFIVRKEAKGRGGRKTGNPAGIEGSTVRPGDRVVILEDVTTTGGSALDAARRMQDECGVEVVAIVSILDREEGGAEAIADAGFELRSLLTMSDITGSGEEE